MNPQRQKHILIGILGCFGLVLGLNYVLIPQLSSSSRLLAGRRSLSQKMTRLHRDLEQAASLEEKRTQLLQQVQLPAASLPPEEQLPDLMEKIAKAARSSQVRLLALRPKEDIGKIAVGASGYLEMPLELTASAGYHAIGRFLDLMEGSQDLLRLRELEIKEGPGESLWEHQVRMVLTAHLVPRPANRPEK